MTDDQVLDRLKQARMRTERTLREVLASGALPGPVSSPGRPERGRRPGAPSGGNGTGPGTGVPAEPSVVTVNVSLRDGAVFLDNERRTRALAKEIRRLIAEDSRRGLPPLG